MKTLRGAKLRAFWPEFLLLPVMLMSLYELNRMLASMPFSTLHDLFSSGALGTLVPACLIYAGAHAMRAARLSLLLGVGKLPFGAILGCHSTVSLVTFSVPFKLGEVVRVLEFYRLTGSNPRAILSIWLERCSDAVVMMFLIELAASSLMDSTMTQLTWRALLLLLGLSIFIALFGRSALVALLRLLSDSNSRRSLNVMRHVRRVEAFFHHMPPLTHANLALLFILSCGIWMLEIIAALLIMAGLTGWQRGAVIVLVDLVTKAVTGANGSIVISLFLYRLMIMGALSALTVLSLKSYVKARALVWPKVDRAQLYRFLPRGAFVPDEQNVRIR